MSALIDLLESRSGELVHRWSRCLGEGPAGLLVREQLAGVVGELRDVLRWDARPEAADRAPVAGRTRLSPGADPGRRVREYGVLPGLVLDLAAEAGVALTPAETRVLVDFVTGAITMAVADDHGRRERDAQEVRDEHRREQSDQRDQQRALMASVHASEERLRRVVEASGTGTWELDLATEALTADRAFRELFGLSVDEPFDLPRALAVIHPDDSPRVARTVAAALAGQDGGRYVMEHRTVPLPDGSFRWVEARGQVTFGPGGQATHFFGTGIDITARKQLEAERERARTRVTEVLESMGDAFLAIDQDWRVTLVNRQYERTTGLGREATLGRVLWDLFPGSSDPSSQYFQGYQRCMRERVAVQFVDCYAPLDLWTDVRAYPAAGGGLSVFFRDVTAERKALEALRVSEERYRALFASIDDGFCLIELIVDAQGQVVDYRFLEANAAFEAQTGLRAPVGQTIRQLAPGISTSWFEIYGRVVATGESVRFENHDPALGRWFDAYASRVEPAGQRQVAIVFKDITARKQAEQQRERLLGELARSNTALDQFAYVASHDLKAPLRGIASLSHFIEEDLGDAVNDDARAKFALMRGRMQRLEALINGILSYATAGRRQATPETVDTGKLVTEVIGLLAPPEHVALTVAEPMPTLETERVLLQQVFMNLIGNAVKHTRHDAAAVRIAAVDEGEAVHFTVADNGPGIAPAFHERIWGIFQKLETRDRVEGTGIGLSVVKKIVESRGGRAWVESEEGHGATFHVVWPRRPAREGDAA